MAKRLSVSQKEEMIKRFLKGRTLEQLSLELGYTKSTIVRNLKKEFGDDEYRNLVKKLKDTKNGKNKKQVAENNIIEVPLNNLSTANLPLNLNDEPHEKGDFLINSPFMEIAPLDIDIDNSSRKDLSSVPIGQIDFPKVVFMIVDKKIELETKLLKDYPEWHFLPDDELNNRTIQIYSDMKDARRNCKKEQKVIKVTNTNVFKIASKIMIKRGISRTISDKQLISL